MTRAWSRFRAWSTSVTTPAGWLLVGGVYLTALLLNVRRVWHFGPDTRFYLAWTHWFGGMSQAEAGRESYRFLNQFPWFSDFCYFDGCDTANPAITYDWLFGGDEGGVVASRVVYPALAAPFVKLFGPAGMLVPTLVAHAACVVLVMVLASRLVGRRWAPLAGVLTVLPISVTAFALYAYTEALAMAFCLACVLFTPLAHGPGWRPRRSHLLWFGGFLTLFAFTRQFHPVVVAGVGLAWLVAAIARRRWRNEWLPYLGVGVGLTVVIAYVQALLSPGYSIMGWFLKESGAQTYGGIPGALPGVLRRIVAGEVFTAGHDFGLVLVAVLGVLGLVVAWREPLAHFIVGMAVATGLLETLTTLPSQNRYWVMSVPLLAISATVFVARLLGQPEAVVAGQPGPPGEVAVVPQPRASTPQTSPSPTSPQQGAEIV